MALRHIIEELVRTTEKSNRQIYDFLREGGIECSRRTIRRYANPIRYEREQQPSAIPKILLFDVETAPMEIYAWSLWEKFRSPTMVIKDVSLLSWSAKWLFESEIMGMHVSADEATNREDGSIIQPIWDLMDKADIVVAHNGIKFDNRVLNTRFMINGLNPPMAYRTVDTYRVAKRNFQLSSYKLDFINKMLGLTPKRETDFSLWQRCVTGDTQALNDMLEYNRIDVVALEECYLTIRPWIKGHPNWALFVDTTEEHCANCGSTNLSWKGRYFTPAGRYRAFRCLGCGAIGRSRYSDLTKEDRERIHMSAM